MKKVLALIALISLTSGCTDAQVGSITALGSRAHATCYSGGKVVFNAISTGRVASATQSDGWQARWQEADAQGRPTGDSFYASISGTCVIKYLD